MTQQKDSQKSGSPQAENQVRGKDLRSQMIESAEYGEQFRASHQGPDSLESQVTPNLKSVSNRPKENSKK